MNSNGDFLREEPPGYGGASRPSAIAAYLRCLEAAHRQGNDTEHTHRPALKALLESLDPRVVATNEPKRIACGAPDLVITRKKDTLLLGHVEAKDIGVSLNEAKKSDQAQNATCPRCPISLLTDYLDFRWFVDGQSATVSGWPRRSPTARSFPTPPPAITRKKFSGNFSPAIPSASKARRNWPVVSRGSRI